MLPDDINVLATAVLSHRVVAAARLNSGAQVQGVSDIIQRIVDETPVPLGPTGTTQPGARSTSTSTNHTIRPFGSR